MKINSDDKINEIKKSNLKWFVLALIIGVILSFVFKAFAWLLFQIIKLIIQYWVAVLSMFVIYIIFKIFRRKKKEKK